MPKFGAKKSSNKSALLPRRSFKDMVFSSSLYERSLKNRTPKRLLFTPVDILPGQAERADTLFQGNFRLQGLMSKFAQEEPWHTSNMPLYWHEELHRFNWLRDFSANGSDAARRHARALLSAWIIEYEAYQPHIWDPYILARRQINWMQQSAFLLTSNDGDFNYKFLKAMRRQLQHLARYCRYFSKDPDRLELYLALYLGAACFTDTRADAPRLEDKLLKAIDKTILPDGCHISRNPSRQLSLLADLIALRETYRNQQIPPPSQVIAAIERLTPAVRFFQHGDGTFALFNGGYGADEALSDQILAISEALTPAPDHLPDGGFERLKAGRATLIFETGSGGRPKDTFHHDGIGSFEFSHGRNQLIVNCGAHPDPGSVWHKALGSTAAHSALCVGDNNTCFPNKPQENTQDPAMVSTYEDGGNLWLDFENPGYNTALNIKHTRRLFLRADGLSLKGEDTVQALGASDTVTNFCLRFHMHPDLSISGSMDGRSLLMLAQDGTGWQFVTSLSEASLEDSIYAQKAGDTRKTQQIVLRGRLNGADPLTIKWALHQSTEKS